MKKTVSVFVVLFVSAMFLFGSGTANAFSYNSYYSSYTSSWGNYSVPSYSYSGYQTPTSKRLSLRQLGLLQLAAHDFFNVDRDTEIDHENGKLDLSTLLDHGEEFIALGGEPRNRENIILFSVAKDYGEDYQKYRSWGLSHDHAYSIILKEYHAELGDVYLELFGEYLPSPKTGEATMTENLAFRTIHDLLPGEITLGGETFMTLDHSLVGRSLSWSELRSQETDELDGEFNDIFRDIQILIPPSTILHIDLLERDSSFASQFGTDFTFEHFMSELEDGKYDSHDDVMHHIENLFAKGLNLE